MTFPTLLRAAIEKNAGEFGKKYSSDNLAQALFLSDAFNSGANSLADLLMKSVEGMRLTRESLKEKCWCHETSHPMIKCDYCDWAEPLDLALSEIEKALKV